MPRDAPDSDRSVSTQYTAQRTLPARDNDRGVSKDSGERAPRTVAARNTHDSDRSLSRSDDHKGRYDISLDELRQHVQNQSAVIVDARAPHDFDRGHLRGAINVPSGKEEAYIGDLLRNADLSQPIIIYCNGPHCPAADTVYDHARSYGFTNMRVFKPGWDALSAMHDLQ
ncbi:MAG TPA: rhodanese-like domain-containing protein [Phycisphaerae bacterium]